MIPNFHIYIPVKNEEFLIKDTVQALMEVFPPQQITVIDIGSTDMSIERLPEGVNIVHHEFPANKPAGRSYTDMKNEYSRRQRWVFWVDGDEIYTTESLLLIKDWLLKIPDAPIENRQYLEIFWKMFKRDGPSGESYAVANEYVRGGEKIFNSDLYEFRKPWPAEAVAFRGEAVTGIKNPRHKSEIRHQFNGVWCWHGVTLTSRSSVSDTARNKKFQSKYHKYNNNLTWTEIPRLPWYANLPHQADYHENTPETWKVWTVDDVVYLTGVGYSQRLKSEVV